MASPLVPMNLINIRHLDIYENPRVRVKDDGQWECSCSLMWAWTQYEDWCEIVCLTSAWDLLSNVFICRVGCVMVSISLLGNFSYKFKKMVSREFSYTWKLISTLKSHPVCVILGNSFFFSPVQLAEYLEGGKIKAMRFSVVIFITTSPPLTHMTVF